MTVGVVGLGMLGRGIAACFLAHGFRVVGFARTAGEHADARREIERDLGELRAAGWEGRYLPTTRYEDLTECEFVVESVAEDASVKAEVFDRIEAAVRPDVVVASNTSAIPISALQAGRKHPGRFVGMHWAEPAHATRFLELIRGEHTTDQTLRAASELAGRLGKEPCVCRKDVPGFLVNRIGYAMYREALHLLDTGVADAETIDTAFRNAAGLWASLCGPFRWIDLTGGPELYARAMRPVLPTLSTTTEVPTPLRRLAEAGAKGVADGRGFYDYTPDEAERWRELHRRHARHATETLNQFHPLKGEPTVGERERKLEAAGYPLDRRTPEGALVDPVAVAGDIVYASGQVPFDGDKLTGVGKVPSQVSVADATKYAELCAANVLRAVRAHVGPLDRLRVVRITGYVNADPDFTDCHLVVNGASNLVRAVFGDDGKHARTALAMAQLPLGVSVEIEMILQLKESS